MATTIEMQHTNYNVVTDNGTMKLEGTFNIDMNGKMNYNVSIYNRLLLNILQIISQKYGCYF